MSINEVLLFIHMFFLVNQLLVKIFIKEEKRVSVKRINSHSVDLAELVKQWDVPVGVLLDGNCSGIDRVLLQVS